MLSLITMVVTIGCWGGGHPPRSLGVLVALALFYWAMTALVARDAAMGTRMPWRGGDKMILGGLLVLLEAVAMWIEDTPTPGLGFVVGLACIVAGAQMKRSPGTSIRR